MTSASFREFFYAIDVAGVRVFVCRDDPAIHAQRNPSSI
jgi:hypothetical protein